MNRMNTQRIGVRVLMGGALSLAVSCTRNSDPAPSHAAATAPSTTAAIAPATQSSAQHWVQDSHLRSLMGIISKQTAAVPGAGADVETPPGFIKNQPFDQAATLAEGLSQTALMISRVPGKVRMSEADQHGFDAEAAKLHELAQELKTEAQAHQIERMQSTMNSISSTCTACHTRYRDLSGVLQPRAMLDLD